MAAFPALTPNERNYDLGQVPASEFRGQGAVAVLFRTGTIAVGQRLQLVFLKRPTSEVELIWDHYHGQQSAEFTLPSQVWCGHTAGATIADSSLRWRYVERPEPQRISAGVYSVTVTMEAIGVSIGPTVSGALLEYGTAGNINGVLLDALPAQPTPVPDPPDNPPVVTDVAPTTAQLPAGFVAAGAMVELRYASGGILETAGVAAGEGTELRFGTGGLLEPAGVAAGEAVDLSQDP